MHHMSNSVRKVDLAQQLFNTTASHNCSHGSEETLDDVKTAETTDNVKTSSFCYFNSFQP